MTKPSLKRIGQLLVIAAGLGALIFLVWLPFAVIDAQLRGLASRMHSDLRTIATALETYRLDHGRIPTEREGLVALTTPVTYLTSLRTDFYGPERDSALRYISNGEAWVAIGRGPDREFDPSLTSDLLDLPLEQALETLWQSAYDPTNGARSAGDIWRISEERAGRTP